MTFNSIFMLGVLVIWASSAEAWPSTIVDIYHYSGFIRLQEVFVECECGFFCCNDIASSSLSFRSGLKSSWETSEFGESRDNFVLGNFLSQMGRF